MTQLKILSVLVCHIFLLANPLALQAKHILGGTINYRLLETTPQGNRYAFTMNIYRDCFTNGGAQLDPTAMITTFQGNYQSLVNTVAVPLGSRRIIQQEQCDCYELGVYNWTAILPINQLGYTLIYQRCCRPEKVINLLNPGATGFSVVLEITRDGLIQDNASPVFDANIPFITCVGMPVNLKFSTTDPNRDSLKYDYYNVYAGGGNAGSNACDGVTPNPACIPTLAVYKTPTYGANKPFGDNIRIDTTGGELRGFISAIGHYALGIRVLEFRNGKLLSRTYLDVTLTVQGCGQSDSVCILPPRIKGSVFFDENSDGLKNNNDIPLKNILVEIDSTWKTLTDGLGQYGLFVDTNKTYIITPKTKKNYFKSLPQNRTVNTTNANLQVFAGQDFAVQPAIQVSDLAVSCVGGNARPGFSAYTVVTYRNVGTQSLTGTISFTFPISLQPINTSSAGILANNTYQFRFSNLKPFEDSIIRIELKTQLTTQLGSTILYSVEGNVTNALDADTTDNKVQQTVIVRGSYDPNDIKVDVTQFEKKPTDSPKPNIPLTYTIRFQNTGNAEAFRVLVVDTLSEKLDISTLNIISASHNYITYLSKAGNNWVLEALFDFIFLPPQSSNELKSQGFIQYQIKNKPDKVNYSRDSILNRAGIYFDYNLPIITNTAATYFLVSSADDLPKLPFIVFPNPTKDYLTIETKQELNASIYITNLLGQTVAFDHFTGHQKIIDMSKLSSGIYMLYIKAEQGQGQIKIYKE